MLDEDGRDVRARRGRRAVLDSPYLFNGYWGKPEETATACRDGWVTVGDLARRDAEGYLYIVDRKKDMVISGGVNIYPREIEEVLLRASGHRSRPPWSACRTKAGARRCVAFVVVRAGTHVASHELDQRCRRTLSRPQGARRPFVIDALPRNAGGKVLKTKLRAL